SVSTFSSWTTKTFETVFSLPNGMRYSQHGPLFGQSLVQDMLAYRPNNANLTNSLQSFWQNCVFYDIALGFYTFDELSAQSDILSFLKTRTAMTRGFYNEAGGAKTFVDCRTGATTLEQDLLVEQQDFKSRSGNKANVTMKSTDAMASAGWTAMPVAFAYLSNVSTTASKLLIQSAMMNSMDTGLSSMAGNVDADAAIQGYALARAERERETTFGVMGAMAAEMLPLLKNLMEGLMYAVFPLVGLAILFPNGWRAFGYYARMLIWIGLWPVAFALLHYAMTYFGSFAVQKAAAHYDLLGNFSESKYNMYSQMGIMDVMKKYEAIAGYMMTMIPMVTYVMVAQGGAMMAGMLGRVMDGYAKPAESAAMEASAGNFSVGNTNFDNQIAFQHMSAPSQTAGFGQINQGLRQQMYSEGAVTTTFAQSNLPITANTVQNIGSRLQTEHAQAVERSHEASIAQLNATQDVIRQLSSQGSSFNQTHSKGTSTGSTESTSQQNMTNHVTQAAKEWVNQNSHSDETLRRLSAEWGVSGGVNSQNQLIGKLVGAVTGAHAEVSGKVGGGVAGTTSNSDVQQLAQRFAASETFQHTLTKLASDQIANMNSNTTTGSTEQREALEKSVSKMHSATEQQAKTLRESERTSKAEADFRENSASITTPMVGAINNIARQRLTDEGIYEAVAALERGDLKDDNLQRLQEVIKDVVTGQVQTSITANVAQDIRADYQQDKVSVPHQAVKPNHDTHDKVQGVANQVSTAQAASQQSINSSNTDINNKQNEIAADGQHTRQTITDEVGVSQPESRHADSGMTFIANQFNDTLERTRNIGRGENK
ncbi:MAG TPA: conjugal transfer protein TraG N-terminal domain-containing protein, partial [Agitococcus sp.]|nr:conjugal transfer protein TraG N-terminal domain-containing protein [Agitococcus sp.]